MPEVVTSGHKGPRAVGRPIPVGYEFVCGNPECEAVLRTINGENAQHIMGGRREGMSTPGWYVVCPECDTHLFLTEENIDARIKENRNV
jgi:hypothetical protein